MQGTEASSSPPRKGTRKNDPKERTILVPALQVGNKQITPEDGFTWRKYGQKALPGTKYPRREAKSCDQLHMAPEVEKYYREKPSLTKRHYRPVAGGAPFVTCHKCLKLLQLPADFPLFKRVCHQLKCGACQEVLKFSLQIRSHVVSCAPNALGATSSDLDDQNRVIGGNNPHSESHVNSPNADHISYSDDYGYSSSEEDPVSVTPLHSSHCIAYDKPNVSSGIEPIAENVKFASTEPSTSKAPVETDEVAVNSPNISSETEARSQPESSLLHQLMGYSSPSQVLRGKEHILN